MKEEKTRIERILDVLLTGSPLLLKDITRKVSEASGETIKMQNIAILMTRLSSPRRCLLGHFMMKNKTRQGVVYCLVPEILTLPPEEIYGLARKTGKDRSILEKALEKIPELGTYIQKSDRKKQRKKKSPGMASTPRKGRPPKTQYIQVPEEPIPPKITFTDLKEGLQEGIQKIGGLRINFHFTAKLVRNSGRP